MSTIVTIYACSVSLIRAYFINTELFLNAFVFMNNYWVCVFLVSDFDTDTLLALNLFKKIMEQY